MDEFYSFLEAFFLAIILVGLFFIIWDIYFAYENVWGFNDDYLIGIRWFKLPLEEWLFFF
jgi:lycopene cyclase domain-containing protein